jgi:hypothetical protein
MGFGDGGIGTGGSGGIGSGSGSGSATGSGRGMSSVMCSRASTQTCGRTIPRLTAPYIVRSSEPRRYYLPVVGVHGCCPRARPASSAEDRERRGHAYRRTAECVGHRRRMGNSQRDRHRARRNAHRRPLQQENCRYADALTQKLGNHILLRVVVRSRGGQPLDESRQEIWITEEPAIGSGIPTAPHFLESPL